MGMNFEGLLDELLGSSDIIGGADYLTEEALGAFLIIFLAIMGVALLTVVIAYVVNALGTYRLAKKLDIENAFLAWIPYAQFFTLGKVAEKCDERRGNPVKPWGKIYLFGAIGAVVVGAVCNGIGSGINALIPLLGLPFTLIASLVSWVPLVILCICCWKIFREFFPETVNVVLFVISIVFNVQSIILLVASFRQPNPEITYVTDADFSDQPQE